MLTEKQTEYLATIPKDKVVHVKPFDPKVHDTAQAIIKQITKQTQDLQVLFMGASALNLPGQNDIDLNVLCDVKKINAHLPVLEKLFGKATKTGPGLVKWEFKRDGFDVELYMVDSQSPAIVEQIRTYKVLKMNPALLREYEKIKKSADGLAFKTYQKRKYEFFNRILGYE